MLLKTKQGPYTVRRTELSCRGIEADLLIWVTKPVVKEMVADVEQCVRGNQQLIFNLDELVARALLEPRQEDDSHDKTSAR